MITLGIMFPMLSLIHEFIRLQELFGQAGVDVENVDLGIMIEIPASAVLLRISSRRDQICMFEPMT